MSSSTLLASNLGVQVGPAKAPITLLKQLSLLAQPGQVVGICGPNGAGKSTLLKALAGLLPSSGFLSLFGKPLAYYTPKALARQLAFMHQETTIAFDFTAREVVEMGRHPFTGTLGALSKSDDDLVDSCMELTGCATLAARSVRTLSGGERQRVMLARSLAQNTPLLLLDEPTASLDIGIAQDTYALLRRLAAQGKTIVTTLHDLRAAAACCDTLYLLHRGTLITSGPASEVLTTANIQTTYGVTAVPFTTPQGAWDYDLLAPQPLSGSD